MLDLDSNEQLIPLCDVPQHLPPSPRTGRPLHVETIRRWVAAGVFGVRLEVFRLPNGTYTSLEAIKRFMDEVNVARSVPAA